jgi:ribose transport system substrate-binding protein
MAEFTRKSLDRRSWLKRSGAFAATAAAGAATPALAQAGQRYVFLSIVTQVPFWSEHRRGLADAAKLLGVQATFSGPLDFDTAAQARQLDELVATKPNGILVFPGDAEAMTPGINRAADAGIPVITIISDAPKSRRVANMGINGFEAGRLGGEMLANAVGGKGKVILGMFPSPNVLERVEGYKSVFKEKFPGIEVVAVVNDKADPSYAPTAYAQALQAHPGVVGIGGTNGDSGKGAAIAVREAGLKGKVKVVAMDRNADMLKFFDDGTIVGSVAQKSYTESFTGLHFLHWLNSGQLKIVKNPKSMVVNPLPEQILTGVMPITPKNYRELIG